MILSPSLRVVAFLPLLAASMGLGTGCTTAAAVAVPSAPAVAPSSSTLSATPATPTTAPERVLFVGNSYFYYNDSLHNHLRRLVAAADPERAASLQYKSATIGGSSLLHHNVDWLTTPGRIGVAEPFEVVILQDHSGAALSAAREADFREAVAAHDAVIRSRGGRTVLYMTPAYAPEHPSATPSDLGRIEALHSEVGQQIGALVIPVGLAFEAAYRRDPSLRLHNAQDHSHPSLLGSYLAAATVYASLYGASPVGNAYDASGAIDPATARLLQEVAHATVEGYLGVRLTLR